MSGTKKTGTVKFFNNERGYGFIHLPDGTDIFFHITDVAADDDPIKGSTVSFIPRASRDGRPRAFDVTVKAGS
jgi:cold shock CspA family protein